MKEQEKIANVEHLPQLGSLLGFQENKWRVFGTLTFKYQKPAKEQITLLKDFLDLLARMNGADHKRLIWIMRLEGGHENEKGICSDHGLTLRHIHYLLAGDRITNGYQRRFTVKTLCQFLTSSWLHGRAEHSPFVTGKNGLGYVLKCPYGVESVEYEDYVEISPRLTTLLKRQAMEDTTA